jgi:hypothetical protein
MPAERTEHPSAHKKSDVAHPTSCGLKKRDGDAPAIAAAIRIRQSVTCVVFRHRIERQKQSITSTTGEQTHEVHATVLRKRISSPTLYL